METGRSGQEFAGEVAEEGSLGLPRTAGDARVKEEVAALWGMRTSFSRRRGMDRKGCGASTGSSTSSSLARMARRRRV